MYVRVLYFLGMYVAFEGGFSLRCATFLCAVFGNMMVVWRLCDGSFYVCSTDVCIVKKPYTYLC